MKGGFKAKQQSLRMDNAEKVIKYYADMVYRLAFARTGTKYDADEIFQEVQYLKIMKAMNKQYIY